MTNIYQLHAREQKADKLAAVLRGLNVDADLARAMDSADWLKASQVAGCHPPSMDTIALVVEKLAMVTA